MSLALLKLPLVLVAGFSFASTAVSPQKQVATSHEQQKYEKELNTSVLGIPQSSVAWLIPRTYKYIAIAMTITEAAFILADAFRKTPLGEAALEYLCQRPGAHVSISPLFLFGVLGSVVGSYIRFTCYRELGALFTYELTVRDGHKLITTGPYAIVRHPSYTGLIIKFAGVTACALASGSWWAESGIRLTVVGKAIAFIWLSILVAITLVVLRAGNEDAMLRTEFGDEWEVYARKVRYRYVPLVRMTRR